MNIFGWFIYWRKQGYRVYLVDKFTLITKEVLGE